MQLKKHTLLLLALALLISFAQSVSAQRRDREREPKREREHTAEKEATNDFPSKLWYGGGVNIGFGAFNGGSIFVFGLSPMVGYKITGPLSVGPRVAYDFTSLKQPGFKATTLHSWDVGGFVRCRVFRGLFLQAELSNKWFQDKDLNTQERFTDQRVNQRLGAGWNFGEPGGVGSEISILYNFKVANDINGWDNPVEYRFGFTWKF